MRGSADCTPDEVIQCSRQNALFPGGPAWEIRAMVSLKLGTRVAGAGVLALVGWLAGCGGGGGGTGGHLGTGGQTTTGGHPGTGGSATGGTSGLGGSGLGGSNASGGTSGACTGTPTSACSASDCDLFPGC